MTYFLGALRTVHAKGGDVRRKCVCCADQPMAVQYKDYYATLGVSKTATADEIKKAFRQLARKHHPDLAKPKEKAAAEVKFKEINEAYEVLGDAEKRKKYDTLGADWDKPGAGGFQPPPDWGRGNGGFGGMGGGEDVHFGGTGFSDFFESIFGGMGRTAGKAYGGFRQAAAEPKGHDVEADISVTLDEVVNGSKRQISLRREGETKPETYSVRIPAGVHEGQRIRLAGQGGGRLQGGKAGDLYLNVRIQKHPDFTVDGHDLIHEHEIELTKAVLGGEVSVPTLEGIAKLKVPAGTQPGQRFRLKQRGLPNAQGERGDLYVVAEVTIPKTLTAKQRELWEQLAEG